MVVQKHAQVLGADDVAPTVLVLQQQLAVLRAFVKGAMADEMEDVARAGAQAAAAAR